MAHYLRKHNNVPFSYCLQRGILLSYAALQAFAVRPLGRSLGTLYLSLPRNRVTKPIAASRQSTTTVVVVLNVAQTDVVGERLCVAGDLEDVARLSPGRRDGTLLRINRVHARSPSGPPGASGPPLYFTGQQPQQARVSPTEGRRDLSYVLPPSYQIYSPLPAASHVAAVNARKAARASTRAVVRRDGAARPFSASAARFAAREARHSSQVMRITLRSSPSATGHLLLQRTQFR